MARLICGFLRLDGGRASPARVEAMLAILSQQMPGAVRHVATDDQVALGVVQAANPAGAAVPATRVLPVRDGLLAADVRLYPRDGRTPPAGPFDRALARIVSDGDGAPAALHGDFAYALWQRPERRLTLVRDHFGVRPLCWSLSPGRHLAFASTAQALLDSGLAGRALDEDMVAGAVLYEDAFGERTFWRDIRDLRAGHRLEIRPGGAPAVSRYWRLDLSRRLPADSDPATVAAGLAHCLDQAVRRRLPTQGAVVGDLSGGLDSGAIAVLAARALAEEGRAYIGHVHAEAAHGDGPVFRDEEMERAAAIARSAPNIRLETFSWRPLAPDSFDTPVDGPYPGGPRNLVDASLDRAREQGATSVLSGWGGDEIVTWSGAGSPAELFWAGHWRRMARQVAAEAALTGRTRARLLGAQLLLPSLPPRLRAAVHGWFGNPDHPGFVAAQRGFLARHRKGSLRARRWEGGIDTHATRRARIEHWWVEKRLAQEARRAARFGIAVRYPMLDLDLVEYCIAIPGHLYRRQGISRAVARDAMAGLLPDEVRLAPAKAVPHPCSFLRFVEGRDVVLGELARAEASPLARDYLDIAAARRHVRSWPGPQAIRARIAANAAGAGLPIWPEGDIGMVLRLARFLQRTEAAPAVPGADARPAGLDCAGAG